jgi:hypothetical protein
VQARAFWKAVTVDRADLLGRVLALLDDGSARYCVIGGVAVNAYVEPVVTLDIDLVIAAGDRAAVEAALGREFRLERFAHSLNVSAPESDLRVQIRTDVRYAPFVDRAVERDVLDVRLPVAAIEDVLQGKVWAAGDPGRRPSKRQKDFADIARLLDVRPDLRQRVPAEVLAKLVS